MASSLDSIGHFARTITDVKKVFEITKGTDGHDATLASTYSEPEIKKRLRIGLPREFLQEGLDKEVKDTVLKAADDFRRMGNEVTEISLPTSKYGIAVYYIIQPAEFLPTWLVMTVFVTGERETFSATKPKEE